jgi:exonuclease III
MLLRIVTYNILDGGIGRENYILEVLLTIQPDIAILQEVYSLDFLQTLAASLQLKPFFATGNKKRRVALLSRFSILSVNSIHPFPPIWRNIIEACIEYLPGQQLFVFGIHPIANLAGVFELWRWWEAKHIIRCTQPYTSKSCLIAGDFNAIAPDDQVQINTMPNWLKMIFWLQGNRAFRRSVKEYLEAGFTDCFKHLHPQEDGHTLPPSHPNTRLDYIFVNDILKTHLVKCWVVREPTAIQKASDHCPVVAEFEF